MKEIKGKKYYVSLGYIDEEKAANGVNAKDIENVFLPPLNSVMYVDDTDKENIIAFPLIQVNDIQRKNGYFNFSVILNPSKIVFKSEELKRKTNILGLFEVHNSNNTQLIKHIGFYDGKMLSGFWNNHPAPVLIRVSEDKILGE